MTHGTYLDAHLRHVTRVSRAAEHLVHLSALDRLILNIIERKRQ